MQSWSNTRNPWKTVQQGLNLRKMPINTVVKCQHQVWYSHNINPRVLTIFSTNLTDLGIGGVLTSHHTGVHSSFLFCRTWSGRTSNWFINVIWFIFIFSIKWWTLHLLENLITFIFNSNALKLCLKIYYSLNHFKAITSFEKWFN